MITIQRETDNENLFSSSITQLESACQLAHLTVQVRAPPS
jgi:hypothetical protein